ncbi:hypothetical protein [Winogradskyella helgolandensis]|uniref:hypothetical protein n=1 Tax=Winogradskyella helgolandensis TaxID=2697010 RepID=UPI0015C8FDB4|nr:hypothetical protein [Winogradskyella helgolandensis]
MRRFIGLIYRYEGDYKDIIIETHEVNEITRAILSDNIFKMSYTLLDNDTSVQINLKSKDGFAFSGSSKLMGDDGFAGKIDLNFYSNKTKSILIGKWIEDGEIDTCIIELEEVKEFKD